MRTVVSKAWNSLLDSFGTDVASTILLGWTVTSGPSWTRRCLKGSERDKANTHGPPGYNTSCYSYESDILVNLIFVLWDPPKAYELYNLDQKRCWWGWELCQPLQVHMTKWFTLEVGDHLSQWSASPPALLLRRWIRLRTIIENTRPGTVWWAMDRSSGMLHFIRSSTLNVSRTNGKVGALRIVKGQDHHSSFIHIRGARYEHEYGVEFFEKYLTATCEKKVESLLVLCLKNLRLQWNPQGDRHRGKWF